MEVLYKRKRDICFQRYIFNNNLQTLHIFFNISTQHIKVFIVSRYKVLYANIIEMASVWLVRILQFLSFLHRHQNAGHSLASSAGIGESYLALGQSYTTNDSSVSNRRIR